MVLKKAFPFKTSIKTNALIGFILSCFILFIIFFLKPFDVGTANFPYKTLYFIGYGVIAFLTYFITHVISIFYYDNKKSWMLFNEIITCLIFVSVSIIIAFLYTELIINKKPERIYKIYYVWGWFKVVFLGFGVLLTVTSILLRKKFSKKSIKTIVDFSHKKVKIYGSLKKDYFFIDIQNLVYVKSENNYVNLFYFEKELLKERLIRSTLTNIENQLPSFLKVHRSYIVNPEYVISLKGNKQNAKLYLNKVVNTIPISTSYFDDVYNIIKVVEEVLPK